LLDEYSSATDWTAFHNNIYSIDNYPSELKWWTDDQVTP
jgi:hypothetical protein